MGLAEWVRGISPPGMGGMLKEVAECTAVPRLGSGKDKHVYFWNSVHNSALKVLLSMLKHHDGMLADPSGHLPRAQSTF